LRELQLTWAVPNQLVQAGLLTAFGKSVVKECNRLGLIVDLTHIPERAFYEVLEATDKPVIISHGAAKSVRTDLDDKRLQAMAQTGGVIGIHFYSSYLGANPTVEAVVDHIDYISSLVGIDHVGLGVDFFPTEGAWRDFQVAQGTIDIAWAIEDMSQMPKVTETIPLTSVGWR
jgi:membrane dipeptidase